MSKNLTATFFKKIKEDYKKKSLNITKSFERRKKKKATILLWMIQKSLRRLRKKACWVHEKILQNEEKWFIIIIRKFFNLENFS